VKRAVHIYIAQVMDPEGIEPKPDAVFWIPWLRIWLKYTYF